MKYSWVQHTRPIRLKTKYLNSLLNSVCFLWCIPLLPGMPSHESLNTNSTVHKALCHLSVNNILLLLLFQQLHSHGAVIGCLEDNISKLNDTCRFQMMRIAELQADDYHLDRPLFYACRDDRERLCPETPSGGGRIYQCLFRHKFQRDMTDEVEHSWILYISFRNWCIKTLINHY